MELSDSNIKIFLIFSEKESFLIFWEMKPCTFHRKFEKKNIVCYKKLSYIFSKKTLLIFHGTKNPQRESFSYTLGNKKTPKKFFIFKERKLSYIAESNFGSSKNKKNPILKFL